MKSTLEFSTLLLLALSNLTSCSGPEGPAGLNLKGNIVGKCYINLLSGTVTDHSGILVSAEGTGLTALTDKDGWYTLNDLPTGTYTVAFSKSGYGTWKNPGFQIVGGGTVQGPYAYIYPLPDFSITNLTARAFSTSINLQGTVTGPQSSNYRYGMFFIGRASNVSSNPQTYLLASQFYLPGNSSTVLAILDTMVLHQAGILKGQTAYIVAYSDGSYGISYTDLQTRRRIYPFLSQTPSNTVNAIVP
ncbi:MAG: hypothetical protein HW407_761 [Bacteroidetes bacterium]|nr:hypothetical protein [Bacteroidota bacterium]